MFLLAILLFTTKSFMMVCRGTAETLQDRGELCFVNVYLAILCAVEETAQTWSSVSFVLPTLPRHQSQLPNSWATRKLSHLDQWAAKFLRDDSL